MYLTVVFRNGIPDNPVHMGLDWHSESDIFLETCEKEVPEFGDFTKEDRDSVLDDGYLETSDDTTTVFFLDLTNTPGYDRVIEDVQSGNSLG